MLASAIRFNFDPGKARYFARRTIENLLNNLTLYSLFWISSIYRITVPPLSATYMVKNMLSGYKLITKGSSLNMVVGTLFENALIRQLP